MKIILLISAMVLFLLLPLYSGQAKEQGKDIKEFPPLRIVKTEGKDENIHHLMLGDRIIHTDTEHLTLKMEGLYDVDTHYVVLLSEFSRDNSCRMTFRFVSIAKDYDQTFSSEQANAQWWQRSYHWIASFFFSDMPSDEDPISEKITVSEYFGTCSDFFSVIQNNGMYPDDYKIILQVKDQRNPAEKGGAKIFVYNPDDVEMPEGHMW